MKEKLEVNERILKTSGVRNKGRLLKSLSVSFFILIYNLLFYI